MKRFPPLLLPTTAVAVTLAILVSADWSATITERTRDGQPGQNPHASDVRQGDDRPRVNEPAFSAEVSSVKSPPPSLAQRTSWTNPYAESLWKSANWQFNEDSMTALPAPGLNAHMSCTAEFLREWTTFTAALHVKLVTEGGGLPQQRQPLELDLVHTKSGDSLRVSLQADRAIVQRIESSQAIQVRETALTGVGDTGELRLSLTPNRLLVRLGGRLLLNVPRPSFLTGERCRFRVSAPAGATITALRFDGE